jgi:hypothetical protein
MKRAYMFNIVGIIAILGISLGAFIPASASSMATIDFEGLAEGAIINAVSSGNGISGDPVNGFVKVYGFNPDFPGVNAAMIFDSTCPGGCSGGDDDLFWPTLGNVLIVSEDLDQTDPDDADRRGAYFTFNFKKFGTGKVTVESLVLGDVEQVEATGKVKLYGNGALLAEVPIPVTGDGNFTTLPIGVSGVQFIKVILKGSVAVDNIKVKVDQPPGDDGCTPGYWKNHPDAWAATGYSMSQTVEEVFDVPDKFNLDNKTLLQALKFKGGPYKIGAARILLRHATAAVLNASHPDVDYPLNSTSIINKVNSALTGSRGEMLSLKRQLDFFNNLGCPLK